MYFAARFMFVSFAYEVLASANVRRVGSPSNPHPPEHNTASRTPYTVPVLYARGRVGYKPELSGLFPGQDPLAEAKACAAQIGVGYEHRGAKFTVSQGRLAGYPVRCRKAWYRHSPSSRSIAKNRAVSIRRR